MRFSRKFVCVGLLPLCVLFPSCKDKDDVKVYRVSKAEPESQPPQDAANSMPESLRVIPMGAGALGESNSSIAQAPQVTGTASPQWESQPLSPMREASYLVKGDKGTTLDISLVILEGAAGGILENINRWLSQLGQSAITAEQMDKMTQHLSSSLGDVTVVDLEGLPEGADATKDGRIIAGIVSGNNKTYFFKMRGNAALAESQKEEFIRWIGTVQIFQTTLSPNVPTSAATNLMEKPQITWVVPEGWKSVAPSAMRYASFLLTKKNSASVDISVSVLGGQGGSDLENVNRWRSQIALEALGAGDLKSLIVPVSCKDAQILTVDMTGSQSRVLAGWARIDNKNWFFKLIGPDRLAAEEKMAFMTFLRSVQFHP